MISFFDGRTVHSVWKVPSLRWWLLHFLITVSSAWVRFRLDEEEVLALSPPREDEE